MTSSRSPRSKRSSTRAMSSARRTSLPTSGPTRTAPACSRPPNARPPTPNAETSRPRPLCADGAYSSSVRARAPRLCPHDLERRADFGGRIRSRCSRCRGCRGVRSFRRSESRPGCLGAVCRSGARCARVAARDQSGVDQARRSRLARAPLAAQYRGLGDRPSTLVVATCSGPGVDVGIQSTSHR